MLRAHDASYFRLKVVALGVYFGNADWVIWQYKPRGRSVCKWRVFDDGTSSLGVRLPEADPLLRALYLTKRRIFVEADRLNLFSAVGIRVANDFNRQGPLPRGRGEFCGLNRLLPGCALSRLDCTTSILHDRATRRFALQLGDCFGLGCGRG